MGPWVIPAAIAGAQIVGGLINNQDNQSNAQRSREWQGDQERSAREFSERMSSTAHQREVEDLKKAGLNPILSANAGASSPGGSAPSGATAQSDNVMQPALSSAMEAMRLRQDLASQQAQTELAKSQKIATDVNSEVARKGLPESDLKNKIYQSLTSTYQDFRSALNSNANPFSRSYDPNKLKEQIKLNMHKP